MRFIGVSDTCLTQVKTGMYSSATAYYRDRDGELVDLDGNVVGLCYPFPGPKLDCGTSVGRIEGVRKLRCETDYTAEDINDNRP